MIGASYGLHQRISHLTYLLTVFKLDLKQSIRGSRYDAGGIHLELLYRPRQESNLPSRSSWILNLAAQPSVAVVSSLPRTNLLLCHHQAVG